LVRYRVSPTSMTAGSVDAVAEGQRIRLSAVRQLLDIRTGTPEMAQADIIAMTTLLLGSERGVRAENTSRALDNIMRLASAFYTSYGVTALEAGRHWTAQRAVLARRLHEIAYYWLGQRDFLAASR